MTSFLTQNWLAVSIAVVSGLMLLWPMLARRFSGANGVSAAGAVQMLNRSQAVLLDTREAAEVEKKHIAQSRHIALSQLPSRLNELQKFKEKPVVLLSDAGGRALAATALLRKNGFSQVYTLEGGIEAWEKAGLPLAR